jgi:hypothetical protein
MRWSSTVAANGRAQVRRRWSIARVLRTAAGSLVYLLCRPQRARGKFLFSELRLAASELHLEMEPPVPRLLRASSHAGAALRLVGDVAMSTTPARIPFCVLRLRIWDGAHAFGAGADAAASRCGRCGRCELRGRLRRSPLCRECGHCSALVYLFCCPSCARGRVRFSEIADRELGLEMARPAPRILGAAAHALCAVAVLGEVGDCRRRGSAAAAAGAVRARP